MLVYKYGARPGGENIRAQMRAGHLYYNALVEAENARRREAWGGESPAAPPHDDCAVPRCPECQAHWKAIRERVRALPPLDLKPLRAARPDGLFWGTYLLIEEAFSAAWKKTDACKPVRFRSWRQGAQAGVQVHLGRADGYPSTRPPSACGYRNNASAEAYDLRRGDSVRVAQRDGVAMPAQRNNPYHAHPFRG